MDGLLDEVATRRARRHTAIGSVDAELRLRPGLRLLWRGPTEVQVGTDPRWSVVLTDLDPTAARVLTDAPPGVTTRALRRTLTAAGVGREGVDAILDHLGAAHLLTALPGPDPRPDEETWSLLDEAVVPGSERHRSVRPRASTSVRVHGLGRLGTGIAVTLASAGVGTLHLEDPGAVTRHDVGAGLTARDIGRSRAGAVARVVLDAAPTVTIANAPAARVDLVVLVEHDAADPVGYRALLSDDVPHLSVVVREASVLVGPLVRPGATACLRCVDLHRTDRDDRWPVLAAQLVARRGPRHEETAMASVAGAIAAAQVLAHLDGRPCAVSDGAIELRLPDLLPHHVRWPAHPDCGCVAVPAPASAPPRWDERARLPAPDTADPGAVRAGVS